jgi:hypothetical protein
MPPPHPHALEGPALTADTPGHVCGIRAVLGVVPTGCRQGGLQPLRPFLVGLGQSPHLIGSQTQITEHRVERLAAVDGVEELLTYFDWEPLLCSGSPAGALVVSVRPTTRAQWHPVCQPALVPCAVSPTRLRVAKSPLAAPWRRSSLEADSASSVPARQDSYLISSSPPYHWPSEPRSL